MKITVLLLLLAVSACAGQTQDQITDTAQADIIKACASSGFFKSVNGAAGTLVPALALPAVLANAGVDVVCANPAVFAQKAGTAAWLVTKFAEAHKIK